MAAVVMTGTGIYSADGNASTQSITIGIASRLGDRSGPGSSFTTGSGSVTRKFAVEPTLYERFKSISGFAVAATGSYYAILDPGVTEDVILGTGTPEIGNWNLYVVGAYYLSTNALSAFQYQRIRLNSDTTYNYTSGAVTYNIRTETKNESYSSDTTNFPTTKADVVVVAGTGYVLRLAARTSAAVGSRTIWRVHTENVFTN